MNKDPYRARSGTKPLILSVIFAVAAVVMFWMTKTGYEQGQVWLTFLGACLFLTTVTISASAWVIALWRWFCVGRQPMDPEG